MSPESNEPRNQRRLSDDDLARLLHEVDPVASEAPLQPDEEDRVRRALDHASGDLPSRRWSRRGLVALAAAASLTVIVWLVGPEAPDRIEPAPDNPATATSRPPTGSGGLAGAPGPPIAPVRLQPRRLTPSAVLTAPRPLRPTLDPEPREEHREREFHDTHLTAANGTRIVWTVSVSEAPDDGSMETRS